MHASHGGRTFKIEEDANAGFYVYAFEGEKCTHDYLQDTLELAKHIFRLTRRCSRHLARFVSFPCDD